MTIDIPKGTQFKGKYRICNLWLAEPVWQVRAELRENCLNVFCTFHSIRIMVVRLELR